MPRVFHHDVTASYPASELKNLPGVPTYAARVLASSLPEDVVILPKEAMPYYPAIQSHYERIGLPFAKTVLAGDYQTLSRFPHHELSVFYFGEQAHAARGDKRWHYAAQFLNSKNNFIGLCQELGIKVPRTLCYNDHDHFRAYARHVGMDYPVYVKTSVSASGFGVVRCDNWESFSAAVKLEVPFQVQESLPEGTQFLNVQYEVDSSDKLCPGPMTYQILEGNTHCGNLFPTTADEEQIRLITDVLARWADAMGMRGVWAYDVALTPEGKVFPVECNPRWNGASYFSKVAEKLGVPSWESRNVSFTRRGLEDFELGELSFDKRGAVGIVIVNWACAGDGKIGVLVAGSPEVRRDYLYELKERLK